MFLKKYELKMTIYNLENKSWNKTNERRIKWT